MQFTDKYLKVKFLALAFLLVFCFACSKGPYVPKSEAPTVEDQNPAVIYDKAIRKVIAVDHIGSVKLPDGRLEVKASIRNRKKYRVHIQAQTAFLGGDGFSLGEDSAWQSIILMPNETKTYSCTSMKTEAVDYKVRIRMAR